MTEEEPPREAVARIVRSYAAPARWSGWTGGDAPTWDTVSASDKACFEAFVNAALDWLEAEVQRVRVAEIEASGVLQRAAPLLASALREAGPLVGQRIAGMRAMKPKLTVNDVIKAERREATGQLDRTGPTASDDAERARSPTGRAARDVDWMREVIFPRFWPGHDRRVPRPKAEEIAARRRGATVAAVKSWRENNKPR